MENTSAKDQSRDLLSPEVLRFLAGNPLGLTGYYVFMDCLRVITDYCSDVETFTHRSASSKKSLWGKISLNTSLSTAGEVFLTTSKCLLKRLFLTNSIILTVVL